MMFGVFNHLRKFTFNCIPQAEDIAHWLTQGEFGELLGVSTQAVSKWEREICYPDIFLIPTISDLIGISIDEMMKQEHIGDKVNYNKNI